MRERGRRKQLPAARGHTARLDTARAQRYCSRVFLEPIESAGLRTDPAGQQLALCSSERSGLSARAVHGKAPAGGGGAVGRAWRGGSRRAHHRHDPGWGSVHLVGRPNPTVVAYVALVVCSVAVRHIGDCERETKSSRADSFFPLQAVSVADSATKTKKKGIGDRGGRGRGRVSE